MTPLLDRDFPDPGILAGRDDGDVVELRDGTLMLVYHGWADGLVGYDRGGYRTLYATPLTWQGGRPCV